MADFLVRRGVSGLEQFGGRISEEWLRSLQGERGRKIYREMSDNDPTVGSVLFAVEMLLRNVEWRVEPFSADPLHEDQAEFVESLMDDMSITWADFIAEALSMLVFGFCPFEILYKRREGMVQDDPARRSKHSDGLIGWRKLAVRAQETLDRWEFDHEGGVAGMWQIPPSGSVGTGALTGAPVLIPIEKMLIFRTTSRKGNPEGRSALRNAFLPWFRKKRIEEAEAIGIDRDLAGMPIFYLPPQMFDANAPAETKAQLASYRQVIENVKHDEQGGLLIPSMYDANNNQLVKFELAGTGARRLIDTNAVVQRYDRQIAQVVLADFIHLGHASVGSFALSSDKTDLFGTALGAWLKEIASVVNRHGISRLYALNGWDPTEAAKLCPGDIEKADVERFAAAVASLTGAGWLVPGGKDDENVVRELLDLPERTEDAMPAAPPGADPDDPDADPNATPDPNAPPADDDDEDEYPPAGGAPRRPAQPTREEE